MMLLPAALPTARRARRRSPRAPTTRAPPIADKMGPPAKPVAAPSADAFPADSSGVPSEDMRVPSLHDLGYQDEMIPATCPFPGGETEGYRRLKEHMARYVVFRSTKLDKFKILTVDVEETNKYAML